jgi:aspartyl-tRNA(Asn)/glutamyl-tRNA(Gln) amidotransferase subunit A
MMLAKDFIKKVQKKEIDIVEHTHKVLEECKKINKEYGYFTVFSEELALSQAENIKKNPKKPLAGLPISVKDCICVKDVETTASSRILKGYNPLFNATAVQKLIDAGAIIIGKTVHDEFGFGGFSTNVGLDFNIPKNPFDKSRATGGSSGGCAGISQKLDLPHVSLGESTGGSIVNPASFCGVYGLCPTYGRVSRYGLLDYGNSLDKIGTLSKNLEDSALILKHISGIDSNDCTSLDKPVDDYASFVSKPVKGMKVAIVKEALGEGVDDSVITKLEETKSMLEKQGITVKEISIELPIKYGLACYYLLATSEASTNLAKFCGIRYGAAEKLEGSFNEYFTKVRSKHFGKEAKRRIIIGTFSRMAGSRDAFYIKALKVRKKIADEYKKAFKTYDALLTPTVPILPPKFEEIESLSLLQNYMIDIMTVGPNLAGLPHLNIPVGFEKELPIGMLLTADHLEEKKLMQLGGALNGKKM